MATVKSFSVGNGDMFYIRHGSDSFTIIDCCYETKDRWEQQIAEIKDQSKDKGIKRFISTHPDDDHIKGLDDYYNRVGILNFYCVENEATKDDATDDFDRYCSLRDSDNAYYLSKDCSRKWLNNSDDERGSAGINCIWPVLANTEYIQALENAKKGDSPNNISPIVKYSTGDVTFLWMGDIENGFLEKVKDDITFPKTTVLFAPHHGRDSGKVPKDVLDKISPELIIIGEAPSGNLNYYSGYNTITQNSAGDILFITYEDGLNIYVEDDNYSVDFLIDNDCTDLPDCHYIGTLEL